MSRDEAKSPGGDRSALFERMRMAVERNDIEQMVDISDVLERADNLPAGFDAELAAEVQDDIGRWLAERSDPRAAEAHARALRLLTSIPDALPDLLFEQAEVLVRLARERGDRASAVALLRPLVQLVRIHDGEASSRLEAALQELAELLRQEAETTGASSPKVADELKGEAADIEKQLAAVRDHREARRQQRMGPSPQGLRDGARAQLSERTVHHDPMEVLYCTSRRRLDRTNIFDMFPGEPDPSGAQFEGHYGIAYVSVPKQREIGQSLLADRRMAGRYDAWRGDGPSRYLMDEIHTPEGWNTVAREIAERRRKAASWAAGPEALIYVHGYNTHFHEAMERAAQLGVDLDIAGPVAAYSWPSIGKPGAYTQDVEMCDGTHAGHLAGLIKRIDTLASAAKAGNDHAPRVTLIAHSLGCKFLGRALENIAGSMDCSSHVPRFSEIIFASAAEMTSADLVDTIMRTSALAERFTIYCSSADTALSWRYMRGMLARAPVAGANRVAIARLVAERGLAEKVDVIETSPVSNTASGLMGHSDYATTAIYDLRMQLWVANRAVERQVLLLRIPDEPAHYWQVRSLDDRATNRQRANPLHLTDRTAARRAIEAARGHGSVMTALRHYEKEIDRARLGGREREAELAFNNRILDVLRRMPADAKRVPLPT